MKQLLINPFTRIAGGRALAWGLVFMTAENALERLFSNLLHSHLNAGVTEVAKTAFTAVLANGIVNMLVVALVLYLAGLLISKTRAGIRPIDVLGTTAFAKIALLPIYILMLMPPIFKILCNIKSSGAEDLTPLTVFATIFFGFAVIAAVVWYVKLLYKAFCVSCNVQGTKAVLAFIAALIAAFGIMNLLPEIKW